MTRKLFGWVCDNDQCRKFFSNSMLIIFIEANNTLYHFCSEKCHKTVLYNIDFENSLDNSEET
jgi:hypothetical protein